VPTIPAGRAKVVIVRGAAALITKLNAPDEAVAGVDWLSATVNVTL
jgi:hypothetical protein